MKFTLLTNGKNLGKNSFMENIGKIYGKNSKRKNSKENRMEKSEGIFPEQMWSEKNWS